MGGQPGSHVSPVRPPRHGHTTFVDDPQVLYRFDPGHDVPSGSLARIIDHGPLEGPSLGATASVVGAEDQPPAAGQNVIEGAERLGRRAHRPTVNVEDQRIPPALLEVGRVAQYAVLPETVGTVPRYGLHPPVGLRGEVLVEVG